MTVNKSATGSSASESSRLSELDRTHWLHPQGDLEAAPGTIPQLIMVSGHGATLTDIEGREYVDGMASLWNVNVGYGREVLAAAAAEQMTTLAFSSAYGGFGTAPAIRLAARLAELAPGDLEVTYFASGGAEANDTAYKIARLYWKLRAEPDRVNIISRLRDYHGLTYAATSATGMANFWKGFEAARAGIPPRSRARPVPLRGRRLRRSRLRSCPREDRAGGRPADSGRGRRGAGAGRRWCHRAAG